MLTITTCTPQAHCEGGKTLLGSQLLNLSCLGNMRRAFERYSLALTCYECKTNVNHDTVQMRSYFWVVAQVNPRECHSAGDAKKKNNPLACSPTHCQSGKITEEVEICIFIVGTISVSIMSDPFFNK